MTRPILFLANKDNLMLDFFLDEEVSNLQNVESAKTSNGEIGQMARIFSAIERNLSSDLVNKTGAIYQFNVKGNYACLQIIYLFIYLCIHLLFRK
jgi:hypothetical protein